MSRLRHLDGVPETCVGPHCLMCPQILSGSKRSGKISREPLSIACNAVLRPAKR